MERLLRRKHRKIFWNRLNGNHYLTIVAAVVILLTIIIIVIISMMGTTFRETFAEPDRIECPGLTYQDCELKFCKYDEVIDGPACYMEKNSFGYLVKGITELNNGIEMQLKSKTEETPYGRSIENVTFKVTYLTENILRFQFKDTNRARYEVPVQEDFPLLTNPPTVAVENLTYKINYTKQSQEFNFKIFRKSGAKLWDSSIGGLLLSDQFLQIASYLPTRNVYGLGEHMRHSLRHSMDFVSWPMFSKDTPPTLDGKTKNLYGVHPFYQCLENSGQSHGVLFLNSNAMEATLLPSPAISFRTIGGILDFFVFVGDNPEHVVQLYTSLIGRPMLPPYWALGFQLSRYGYENITKLKEVIERTRRANIPQSVQYLDIDHLSNNRDFTFDNENFTDLPTFIEAQRTEHGLKFIVIVDPGMDTDESYGPYTSGLQQGVYIKRHKSWKPSMFPKGLQGHNVAYGKVWTKNFSAFPDFFLPVTREWWKEQLINYTQTVSFDAIWIDMNEPANFGTNEDEPFYCKDVDTTNCWSLKCPKNQYDDPPYNPMFNTDKKRLSDKTLCMQSVQGNLSKPYLHYDVHSLYGWSQTKPTYEAVQAATLNRSLVLSRSTYPSSGRYAAHWLGDNNSTFKDMKASIIGMLEFNMFGIPYVGADVCGFFGDAEPELCKRWMQLGAFYPFYRNHNGKGQKEQDPASFGRQVVDASRKAVLRRISFNPYLYTLFYKAHVYGNTVVRPMFHEFPTDSETWDMYEQFMWGRDLLIAPILEEFYLETFQCTDIENLSRSHDVADRSLVYVYLPEGEWWYFKEEKAKQETRTDRYVVRANVDDYTPVYIRGGAIFPLGSQDPSQALTNVTFRNITLYVFPYQGIASGDLFIDDGTSIDTIERDAYALYQFTYANCTLTITSNERPSFTGPKPYLVKVIAFKVKDVASASNFTFTLDQKINSVEIQVLNYMIGVPQVTWMASDGSCQMLP